jgi:hypothetical protein
MFAPQITGMEARITTIFKSHGDDGVQIVWKTALVLTSIFVYIMSDVAVYDYSASGLIGIDISTPGDMAMAS